MAEERWIEIALLTIGVVACGSPQSEPGITDRLVGTAQLAEKTPHHDGGSADASAPPAVGTAPDDAGRADAAGAPSAALRECRGSVWGKDDAYDVYGLSIPFCLAEQSGRSTAVTAPPPYERCSAAATTKDRGGRAAAGTFDPERTAAERSKRGNSSRCCYVACVF